MSDAENEPSDVELLIEALDGSTEAFTAFCVRVLPQLLSVQKTRCRRFGIPPDLAEDFAQETLARAIKWVNKNPNSHITNNFLSTISKRVVFDWLRQRRPVSNTDVILTGAAGIPQYEEEMLLVRDAFEHLPRKDQDVLRLVLIQGYTPGEVGPLLGIQSWSAYKRYERALKRLKQILD